MLGYLRTDTNSLWLAEQLALRGVSLAGKAVVGDDRAAIGRALTQAMDAAELVIVTGGLGPTADDVTREAVSEALGLPLEHDEEVASSIAERFEQLGIRMAEVNLRQAKVPEGARVLENHRGTAPGLWLTVSGRAVVLLPGVPREMRGLAREHLLPWLEEDSERPVRRVQVFRVAGLPEATVEERLAPLYERVEPDQVAVLARPGDVRIEVSSTRAGSVVDWDWMRKILGESLYSQGESMEEVVIDACRSRGLRLAAAESCTGGGICARLTDVPGSSEVLLGGVVAYHNAVKQSALGVSTGSLERHGAVSEEVAVEMAEGARTRLEADIGVAVTGVAGPSGGTPDKPVGTVWFAWSLVTAVDTAGVRFPGDRERVRAFAVQWALDGIRRRIVRT